MSRYSFQSPGFNTRSCTSTEFEFGQISIEWHLVPGYRIEPLTYLLPNEPRKQESDMELPGVQNVGSRVSLRLHEAQGGYRDLLGTLQSPDSVQKRDGSLEHFDPSQIALWKVVLPKLWPAGTGAPIGFRIAELEAAAEDTWIADEISDRGSWRYRISSGFTFRANSVRPFGAPGFGEPAGELTKAIADVVRRYAQHHLTPAFHISLPTYRALDEVLAETGWTVAVDAQVMVADSTPVLASCQENIEQVQYFDFPAPDWLAVQGEVRGANIMSRFPAHYVAIKVDDQLVAAGRVAVSNGWAILTRLFVLPEYRGRGLSKAVISELLQQSGATKVMLQVDIENDVAIKLYESIGLRHHHNYRYRTLNLSPTEEIVSR